MKDFKYNTGKYTGKLSSSITVGPTTIELSPGDVVEFHKDTIKIVREDKVINEVKGELQDLTIG